jgi:hypothetical protein
MTNRTNRAKANRVKRIANFEEIKGVKQTMDWSSAGGRRHAYHKPGSNKK